MSESTTTPDETAITTASPAENSTIWGSLRKDMSSLDIWLPLSISLAVLIASIVLFSIDDSPTCPVPSSTEDDKKKKPKKITSVTAIIAAQLLPLSIIALLWIGIEVTIRLCARHAPKVSEHPFFNKKIWVTIIISIGVLIWGIEMGVIGKNGTSCNDGISTPFIAVGSVFAILAVIVIISVVCVLLSEMGILTKLSEMELSGVGSNPDGQSIFDQVSSFFSNQSI